MLLAYRGISVLLLAPLMAAVAVLLSGDLGHMLPLYTSTFMGALGNYMLQFFPVFLLGALFGQLMADSGAATAISHWIMRVLGEKHAILTVVLACAVLTYGGVSLFVVAFAIYPIAKSLFRAAHVPKRLIPPTIALGSFTFTMTALPGTPSIQNAIPIPYYGTNVFAAPGLGIIGGMTMLALGLWWLQSRAAKARVAGEGYGDHDDAVEQGLHDESDPALHSRRDLPLLLALLPLVLVIAVNALWPRTVIATDALKMIPGTEPAKCRTRADQRSGGAYRKPPALQRLFLPRGRLIAVLGPTLRSKLSP